MKYENKTEYERDFVQHLLSVGIKGYSEMYDRGKTYYMFNLKNGETRYWTNLSEESLKALEGKADER